MSSRTHILIVTAVVFAAIAWGVYRIVSSPEWEQFSAAGGNDSQVHEDFMIGSDKLDIDGITKNGKAEPIMRKGEWAFKI